ncbi:MAG: hypothetical protein K6E81_02265 [Lachnospiraceae bacterium]|nr:hypothetical protein [Lachnospiraceae bacterium]
MATAPGKTATAKKTSTTAKKPAAAKKPATTAKKTTAAKKPATTAKKTSTAKKTTAAKKSSTAKKTASSQLKLNAAEKKLIRNYRKLGDGAQLMITAAVEKLADMPAIAAETPSSKKDDAPDLSALLKLLKK